MTNTHSTAQVVPFQFEGSNLRVLDIDGEPWFVAADVARILEYRDAFNMTRRLDQDDKGTRQMSTPSGLQQMTIISEPGFYAAILGSQCEKARDVKRWLTHTVLPEIRKTGGYGTVEMSREELLSRAFVEATKAIEEFKAKAESGERFKREIEAGDGLTLREFHKKYFSEITETEFMEHLYSRAYLINQLGKGTRRTSGPKAGTRRDGNQHRHPTYKGKEFFYLHCAGIHGGKRRETTRVRPGEWEIALRDKLSTEGLAANENAHGLFTIENRATKELQ